MNDAIKKAIKKYLDKRGNYTEENEKLFYSELLDDVNQVKTLRKDLDNSIVELKSEVIKSNIIMLLENVFRENNEKVVEILNNTHDTKIFYNFTDALNKLLINHNQYQSNYSYNAGEIKELKESFVLTDDKLKELITEINLDIK
tara:strand:+ start:349 stop:780 length:432 start_codon:yes stop_codon:yes gene_type:complete